MNLERKVFDMVLLKLDAVSYQSDQRIILDPVSYTHLTLPTKA